MRALGMIETMGLIPSIEALDAMLKAANVEALEKINVRGGIVAVLVVGDVGAVKAAVDAGAVAVQRISQGLLLSQHVIPRPDSQIDVLFKNNKKLQNQIEIADVAEKTESIEDETPNETLNETLDEIHDETLDETPNESLGEDTIESEEVMVLNTRVELELFLEEQGIEKLMQVIKNMRASELKELAKEYEEGELQEDKNARATKAELVDRLYAFYNKVANE